MTKQTPAEKYIESCLIDLSKQLSAAKARIEQLEAALQRSNASLEYYERKFYLGTDRIEQLEAALREIKDCCTLPAQNDSEMREIAHKALERGDD